MPDVTTVQPAISLRACIERAQAAREVLMDRAASYAAAELACGGIIQEATYFDSVAFHLQRYAELLREVGQ